MKVFSICDTTSRGIQRVQDALEKYSPSSIEWVKNASDCDLAVIHIYGRHTTIQKQIEWLKRRNKAYVMIQYVLRSSMRPDARDWSHMWQKAKLVWSYYDLPFLLMMDMQELSDMKPFNFYYAPLGVDSSVFYEREIWGIKRQYIVAASSQHALSESVRECAFATKRVNRRMFFLGHQLRRGDDIFCVSGVSDDTLAGLYSNSVFVSGLRRTEGFELPVIEGAMCGARPIVFNRPEMRKWFSEFAVFIPEGTREQVIDSLEQTFRVGTYPIGRYETELIKERFDWKTIITKFWDKLS